MRSVLEIAWPAIIIWLCIAYVVASLAIPPRWLNLILCTIFVSVVPSGPLLAVAAVVVLCVFYRDQPLVPPNP